MHKLLKNWERTNWEYFEDHRWKTPWSEKTQSMRGIVIWAIDTGDVELQAEAEKRLQELNDSRPLKTDLHERALKRITELEQTDPEAAQRERLERPILVSDVRDHALIYESRKRIIILKEKHGNRYLDASSKDAIAKSLVSIVKKRLEENYWYESTLPEEVSDQLDLFKSNKIPKTQKEIAEGIVELSEKENMFIRAAKQAYHFLRNRTEYQYEEFIIEELDTEYV